MGWNWKIFPTLQLNTCKEHKLLPWYSITKCNFDAIFVSLQDTLVCKCNVDIYGSKMLGIKNKFYIWVLKQNMNFNYKRWGWVSGYMLGLLHFQMFGCGCLKNLIPNLLMLNGFRIWSPTPPCFTHYSNSLVVWRFIFKHAIKQCRFVIDGDKISVDLNYRHNTKILR